MKYLNYAFSLAILSTAALSYADEALLRLSKQDRQDLARLLQDPIEQMNKTIGQLNAYAQQMQVIGDVTAHEDVHHLKQLTEKIAADVQEINTKVDQAFQQIAILRILVGNPDDPSIDPAQFDSIQAIDEAKLPLYQWLKTVTRLIVEGTIVS